MRALPALKFQLDPADHEKYGGDWYVYDESAIARMPVREQLAIEAEIDAVYGYGLVVLFERMRREMLDARLVATWVARRLAGITESLADFQPLVALLRVDPTEPGDDADPPDSGSSESADPSSES